MKCTNLLLLIIFAIVSSNCDDEAPPPPPPTAETTQNPDENAKQSFTDEFGTHTYDPKACTLDPAPTLNELNEFFQWADFHKKTYKTAEKRLCATIKVCYHIREIAYHNKRYAEGKETYQKGLTRYSDLSHDEKAERLLMHHISVPTATFRHKPPKLPHLPPAREYVNYLEEGLVHPVPGLQTRCGSCYAWAGAPPLEAQLRKCGITNETVSIQMMVNCPTIGCWGCQSGWPYWVYKYQMACGILPDAKYPYVDRYGQCSYNASDIMAYVQKPFKWNFTEWNGNSSFIKQVVSAVGPVATGICVEKNLFQYAKGVYQNPTCCTKLKHAVAIVGYGTDPEGGDYWLVKNSWGIWWGDNGFGKIARGNNTCMTETQIQYAQIRKVDGTPCPFPY